MRDPPLRTVRRAAEVENSQVRTIEADVARFGRYVNRREGDAMTVQAMNRGRRSERSARLLGLALVAVAGLGSAAGGGVSASVPPDDTPLVVFHLDRDDGTGRLVFGRPDGSDLTDLIVDDRTGSRDHYRPDVSPDGSVVAFEVYREHPTDPDGRFPSELWVADIDGTNTFVLADCEAPCWQLKYPAFSPDGGFLAFASFEHFDDGSSGASAIEVIDLGTGARTAVASTTDGSTSYLAPQWAPDGPQLVFLVQTFTDEFQDVMTSSQLATIDLLAVDAEPTMLTPPDTFAWGPDWAPGPSILYAQTADESSDEGSLWHVTPDALPEPVPVAGPVWEPIWDPDGATFWLLGEGADGPEGERALVHYDAAGGVLEQFEGWPDGYLSIQVVRPQPG